MSNVVFFGQADAGKSTLAGYLIAKYNRNFKLSDFIEQKKRTEAVFDPELALSSIMNTNRDEIEQFRHLNSKALHLRRVSFPFDNVTIIDTPGSENYRKQRERGMYYGNVGVFFMEINNVINQKYNMETIAPIALWSKLNNKKMIFLLTKFDLVDYNKQMYLQALEEIRDICSFFGFDEKVTVIPTAIEVKKIKELPNILLDTIDIGENICSKSDKMPWFDGMPVVEAIAKEINDQDRIDEEEPLVFCITDQIDRPDSKAGKVWNIKVLSGILKEDQAICLAPVKTINNEFSVLTANVKRLRMDLSRYDQNDEIKVVRKGEICGLDIKNCNIDKHYAKKSEYNAISTTCGFNSKELFAMSDFFSFEVCEEDRDAFKPGSELKLLWFGRSLAFFVNAVKFDNKITVQANLKNTQIALPLYGKKIAENILIKGTGMMDFFNCKLIQIGNTVIK